MTIKHLVISGGGPLGLKFLGALQHLENDGYWKLDDVESIYATSVGSIIGAFICLKYDWETLTKYIIERPWQDAFKVTAKQIFDSYYNKGLFDSQLAEVIFKPLLNAKNMELTITLKEFYEYTKIDFHIFTFELNKFETVELNYKTHPDLSLLKALTMSSALPGIFMPTIIDDNCFIDGGVMCNYPINQCLRDHENEDEIMGIKSTYNVEQDSLKNVKVTQESSLLEYAICLTINAMNYIKDSVKTNNIKNTIKCQVEENPLTLDFILESIKNQEFRKKWIQMGIDDATKYLLEINKCC